MVYDCTIITMTVHKTWPAIRKSISSGTNVINQFDNNVFDSIQSKIWYNIVIKDIIYDL